MSTVHQVIHSSTSPLPRLQLVAIHQNLQPPIKGRVRIAPVWIRPICFQHTWQEINLALRQAAKLSISEIDVLIDNHICVVGSRIVHGANYLASAAYPRRGAG
jgi:hypothetical protein